MQQKKKLSDKERKAFLAALESRFEKNMGRHKGVEWGAVRKRLERDDAKLWSLYQMEETGGEPDVIGFDKKSGPFVFCDCAAESPKGRRSLCYDRQAQQSRKEHQPKNNAVDLADAMGIELLSEEDYRTLQELGEFDLKTSSWVKTPDDIRKHGGAVFCDRRYGRVFTYHNGAQSYYAARGFRGMIKI